jgi:hypothetical protein
MVAEKETGPTTSKKRWQFWIDNVRIKKRLLTYI